MLKRLKQLKKWGLVTSGAEDWYENGDKVARKNVHQIRKWQLNPDSPYRPLVEVALRMVELQRETA